MTLSSSQSKSYQGARWVRADLHLHSPGASSFSFPSGLDASHSDKIVTQYVNQLKEQGIEVAAITDYQQIRTEWFIPIREAALKEGIYVYPGVELSFGGGTGGKSGLHVLAIFPFDANVEGMNRAVEKLLDTSKEPLVDESGEHRDLKPGKSVQECLQQLRKETGCVIIFPHPKDSKGLLKSYQSKAAAEILAAVQPEAIEELSEKIRKPLRDTQVIAHEDLNRIASISSSDNHSIEEIGTKQRPDGAPRAAYLKLSALEDLAAIRLALRDHPILVQLGNKPQPAHTIIEKVEVDGDGFLGGVSIVMGPELNVFIGGRGVGKSALLEVIRYGLSLPVYSPTEYREGLVEYALGGGGKVTIYLRNVIEPSLERRYRIEREVGEEAQVYEMSGSREALVKLPITDLLGNKGRPLFFGQRVLYKITQEPKLRRQFLDDLIGGESREKGLEIEKALQDLRRNATRLLELQGKQHKREEVEHYLRKLEHERRLFEQHGVAEKLQAETALTRDEERLKRTEAVAREFREEWRKIRGRWQERSNAVLVDLAKAESRQQDLLKQDASNVVRLLQEELGKVIQTGDEVFQKADEALHRVRRRWDDGRRALAEELRRIRKELDTEILNPKRLVELTREKEQLGQELDQLKQAEVEMQELELERRNLLQRLRDIQLEAFRLREKRANEITKQIGERVKVEVLYREQRKEYANRLIEFFSGSGILKKDLEKIAQNEEIADGAALAELVRKGKEELMEKTGLSEAQAQRLMSFLKGEGMRLYKLELLSPEDEVRVSLKVSGRWVSLERLSAGQRATAMLLILLTQTQHPLIIDQPEDDLDNRFIYEDVVKLLRKQKGAQQIIVATHNPNIPVLAHGELITTLEARSEHAEVSIQGGMDRREVQDIVRRIMEGGDEAFRRRAEKYGWG